MLEQPVCKRPVFKQLGPLLIAAALAGLLWAALPYAAAQAGPLPAAPAQDATTPVTDTTAMTDTAAMTDVMTDTAATENATDSAADSAADSSAEPAATEAMTTAITPEALANMTYQSFLDPSGFATLTNGTYENTEARVVVGIGQTPTVAYGEIGGLNAAAIIVGESGGGSGLFENLAVVIEQDGVLTNTAITRLGDRVGVDGLTITPDGLIVVDMVTQGPNDPMCCPTSPVTQIYMADGNLLVLVAQVQAVIDASAVTPQVLATILPATAYDNSMPPSGQGQPKHPVWSLDGSDPATVATMGGAYVAIYNVAAFERIWNEAGDNYVSDTIGQLRKLLQDRPESVAPPMPILPEQPGTNDFVAQLAYLDLPDGGSGVRWVGRISQSADPIMEVGNRYFFQGLTGDGQRLIVAQVPITVPVVAGVYTGTVTAAEYDQITSDYNNYIDTTSQALSAAPAGDFAPALTALDQVMQSVTVTELVNTLLPQVLANLTYTSTLIEGTPMPMSNGSFEDTALPLYGTVVPSPIGYGEIDGAWSAAVLIAENGGGSGVFVNLELVQEVDGAPTAIATTLLGDRVNVTSLEIVANQIVVRMITQGPGEPMCCGTLPVEAIYALQNGQLELVSATDLSTGQPLSDTMSAGDAGVSATEEVTATGEITPSAEITTTETVTP